MIRKSLPSGFDPMGGGRFSEKIMLQQKLDAGVAFAAGICIKKAPRLLRSVETDESNGEIAFKSVPSAGEEIQQGRGAPHTRCEGASVAAGQAGCHGAQSHRQARRKAGSQCGRKAHREGCRQKRPVGLWLRRRQGRRPRRNAQSPRWQGRGPCRDGASRPAGAARFHHHHRGLHLFLRARQNLSEGFEAAGRSGARSNRPHHRQKFRR